MRGQPRPGTQAQDVEEAGKTLNESCHDVSVSGRIIGSISASQVEDTIPCCNQQHGLTPTTISFKPEPKGQISSDEKSTKSESPAWKTYANGARIETSEEAQTVSSEEARTETVPSEESDEVEKQKMKTQQAKLLAAVVPLVRSGQASNFITYLSNDNILLVEEFNYQMEFHMAQVNDEGQIVVCGMALDRDELKSLRDAIARVLS